MKVQTMMLFVIAGIIGFSCQQNVKTGRENTVLPTDTTTVIAKMITAKVFIKPGKESDFISAAQIMIENSNNEEDCLEYMLYQDPYESTNFIFVEKYKDQAAIDFHFGTEYFKNFGTITADMTSKPAEVKIIDIISEQ
ncbi:MAG: antibiotic biosynthesis monooxygenase [Bacteroidales bacterium]|nr:antibiotic biosynthesis monooxygenase [Bacteroidales bacterium]